MFLGTLSGPFFNHLIGNSSAGFTDLVLTGERIEAGIKSGKIQKGDRNRAVYGPRRQIKPERCQAINALVISKPAAAPQQYNQQRGERSKRQYTRLSMTLSQILPQLLSTNTQLSITYQHLKLAKPQNPTY